MSAGVGRGMDDPAVEPIREPAAGDGPSGGGGGKGGGGLRKKTTAGLLYMLSQTVLMRFVSLGAQILLAWILIPDDFALYGIAMTIGQIVGIVRQAGVRDILIHRQHRAKKWTNAAFWMTLTTGLVLGAMLAAATPALASFFKRPELIPLILVLAVASPFQCIAQIGLALIQAKMRFKLLATVELGNNLVLTALKIVFALMGMGAMSFILPLLIVAILKVLVLYPIAKPKIRWNPQFRRWKYLIGDSLRLIGGGLGWALVIQGDYLVLGRLFPGAAAIGHYFFAYQLSSQTVTLFGRSLDMVLFPVLSTIQTDKDRQRRGFLRALRAMAVGGIPACMLQAAAAEPLFLAVMPEKFHASIPYVMLLSLAMAGRLMAPPSRAMMRAQGRFSVYWWMTWMYAASLIITASLEGMVGTPLTVAIVVAANLLVWGAAFIYATLRTAPGALRGTLSVITAPTLLGGIACSAGYGVSLLIGDATVWHSLARVAVILAVSGAIYAPAIWMIDREACRDLIDPIIGKLLRKGRKRAGLAQTDEV